MNLDEGYYGQVYALIYDITDGIDLLYAYNSQVGGNVILELGQPVGNNSQYLFGSLAGLLTAGHQYQFVYSTYVQANSGSATNDINGTGFVSLQLGTLEAQEVPEPLSLTIWGLVGASGAIATYVQRRRKAKIAATV